MKSQGTSKAGEMDWEGGLKEMIENNLWGLVCDKCTGGGRDYDEGDKCEQCHGNGVYDWRVEPLVSEVKKIIQQAIAQERKRIAEDMDLIIQDFDEHSIDEIKYALNKFHKKLLSITNNHE